MCTVFILQMCLFSNIKYGGQIQSFLRLLSITNTAIHLSQSDCVELADW